MLIPNKYEVSIVLGILIESLNAQPILFIYQGFNVTTLTLGLQGWGMAKEMSPHGGQVVLKFKCTFTNVGECKKVGPNIAKWISTLRVESLRVFQIFGAMFERSNIVQIELFHTVGKFLNSW